jgi:hypothetical protein
MRNRSREMMQCLCDIKAYINAQYFLSRTEINFYLTPESNTIFFIRPKYPYKSAMLFGCRRNPNENAFNVKVNKAEAVSERSSLHCNVWASQARKILVGSNSWANNLVGFEDEASYLFHFSGRN